ECYDVDPERVRSRGSAQPASDVQATLVARQVVAIHHPAHGGRQRGCAIDLLVSRVYAVRCRTRDEPRRCATRNACANHLRSEAANVLAHDRRSIDALAAQRTGHDCELHGCIATAQIELGVRLEVPALVRLLDALGQCAATLDAFKDGGRGGVPYDGGLVPAALQLGQLARELLTGPAKHRVAADGSSV